MQEYKQRNLVCLNGVVIRTTPSTTKAPSRFTVRVDEEYVWNGEKKSKRSFVSCKTFGDCPIVGDVISSYGSIREGSYEKDGEKEYYTDIIVGKINVVDHITESEVNANSSEGVPSDEEIDAVLDGKADPLDSLNETNLGDIPF